MSKKVVAALTLVVYLFTTIPTDGLSFVQAATGESITLYDLGNDSNLTIGESMSSPALEKAGGPTIDVVQGNNGPSLHVTNVVNSWDGVDLKPTALMQPDGSYLAGAYTFTVSGHVDPGVVSSYVNKAGNPDTLQMVFGMSADPYSWFANQTISADGDGTFTLTYNTTFSSASELSNLGYNFRIQKNGEGLATSPTSFYIDNITVNVIPSSGEQPETPVEPDNNLPVGTTATLYDLDADTNISVDGSLDDTLALANSGDGEISIVQGNDGTVSLYVHNRVNNWDGVDLFRSALMHENAYYAGDYVFTVKGHLDLADVADSSRFVFGMSQSPWGELNKVDVASDGTFTLNYTKNYSTAAFAALPYDFRIQTTDKNPLAYYIDSITVTVTGTAPKVKQLYTFPFDDEATQGSFFAPTTSSAELAWVNQPSIGHDDDAALQVTHKGTDYTGANNAVRLTLPKPLPVSAAYNISAWVYVPVEANTGKSTLTGPSIVLNGDYAGATDASKFPADGGNIAVGTWQELNVTLPMNTTPISTIDFLFATDDATTHPDEWRFDNIVITQVGDRIITPKWELDLPSLAEAYNSVFLSGNIMSPEQTTDTELTNMYKHQYNVVTAENAMKPQNLSSAKGVYNYTEADKIINWAQENDILVHGHTLVWHSQSADWLTKNGNSPLTREEARANMQSYINEVAGYFAGKVISWDVANEVFQNDVYTAPEDWKSVLRGAPGVSDTSPWYAAYANGADTSKGESGADFIYDAFAFTRLADPDSKLFYNDYNEIEVGKSEAIAMMVEELNEKWKTDPRNTDSDRPLIEGVGMQAHYWTGELNPADVEAAIKRFIKAGADVAVSELDIPVGTYPTYQQNTELTEADAKIQADLYKQLYKIYIKYANNIDRVTIWGKADPQSWRFEGYPTLFDDSFAAKDAFYAVIEAAADIIPTPVQYTVTFDSQGGSALSSQVVDADSIITASTAPTKTGYTFGGWYKDATCTTAWNFATDKVTSNVTLFAKWTVNKYVVTFNSQGGNAVASQSINYDGKITAPKSPTKTGYTFGGWYKDAACKTVWNFATDNVTTNVTLFAKWNVNKYTVTFNSKGGSKLASQSINYNDTITKPKTPTKTGYTFSGWYKDAACKYVWNFASDKVTKTTTLYAKWVVNKYTVKFNSVGGSKIKSKTANYNTHIAAPKVPTRSGYTFLGWYKDSKYKAKWYFSKTTVKKNTTLYAKWAKNPSAPKKVSIVKSKSRTVKISWSKVSGVRGYKVYRATSKYGKYTLLKTTTKNSYTSKSLSKGKTYYYKVRFYKLVDKQRVYSSYTKIFSIRY